MPPPRNLIQKMVIALLVLAGGVLFWVYQTRPLVVELTPVSVGPMEVYIEEDGKTRIKDRYVISSPMLGTLLRIHLRAGDAVCARDTILTSIQPTAPGLLDARQKKQAESRMKAAEMAVTQSEASAYREREALSFTEKTLQRLQSLTESKSVSTQELEKALSDFESQKALFSVSELAKKIAQFELEVASAALLHAETEEDSKTDLEFKIRSPIDGRILRVFQESSSVVQPGTPLIEIGDPKGIEIEVDVLSSDAVKIAEGNDVVIDHWGGDKPLHGRVRRIEPSAYTKISALGVEEQRVNVLIDIVEPIAERLSLGDAFRVDCRVIYWSQPDVVRIPSSCLVRNGKQWVVFKVERGIVRETEVQVGHQNRDYAEVLEGLQPKDLLVLFPSDTLRDGVRVRSNKPIM